MSHKKNFVRSKNKYASKEDEKQTLSVFGYSCRLYEEPEYSKSNPKAAEEPGGHKYLLSWNGDEDVRIDRFMSLNFVDGFDSCDTKDTLPLPPQLFFSDSYDCRLYLNSLDEFDRSKSGNNGAKHGMDEAEGMEEEMCEEERYSDMYVDMQKIEEEEQVLRGRRAEFAFNYDSTPAETSARPEESSSSEEEIEEQYEMPEGLKLPVGIDLPETMKHSTIIEKTAMFVVQQGPQMEVVIKAKQRNNIQQFGFLEFDDRLNPFYKYVCKLIREKKYTPVPYITKTRPKTKKLCRLAAQARLEESLKADAEAKSKQIDRQRSKPPNALEMIAHDNQSGSDASNDDSDVEGYLHPLLMASSTKKVAQPELKPAAVTARRSRLADAPVIFGPMPQPVVKHVVQVKTAPNFDEILQQHHSNAQSNVDNIYSSLFKNLNSLLPGAKARAEEEELQKKKEEEDKAAKEIALEADEEKIRDYNDWHMEFYGRPSPYLPSAHPVALPPPPNLSSALSIAARYVALNGGAAEQKLIDHNGESCEFLFPKSPYYTYYQLRVRYNQWMMNQSYLAAAAAKQISQQGAPISSEKDDQSDDIVFASTSSCIFPAPPRPPNGVNNENSIVPTELPLLMKSSSANTLETNDEPDIDNVEAALKMERKEKARLFMEKILNEKLAAKKRAQDGEQESTTAASKFASKETDQSGKAAAALPPPTLLTSDTITSLIDRQIQRVFKGSSPVIENSEATKLVKSSKKELDEDRKRFKRNEVVLMTQMRVPTPAAQAVVEDAEKRRGEDTGVEAHQGIRSLGITMHLTRVVVPGLDPAGAQAEIAATYHAAGGLVPEVKLSDRIFRAAVLLTSCYVISALRYGCKFGGEKKPFRPGCFCKAVSLGNKFGGGKKPFRPGCFCKAVSLGNKFGGGKKPFRPGCFCKAVSLGNKFGGGKKLFRPGCFCKAVSLGNKFGGGKKPFRPGCFCKAVSLGNKFGGGKKPFRPGCFCKAVSLGNKFGGGKKPFRPGCFCKAVSLGNKFGGGKKPFQPVEFSMPLAKF